MIEQVKKTFKGRHNERFSFEVFLEDNEALGIKRRRLTVSGTEMLEIWRPVMEETIKVVMEQVKGSASLPNAILLVGGFGANNYLREELSREAKTVSESIEILRPRKAWTAVVEGALMRALATSSPATARVRVGSRAARKHYGVSVEFPFVRGKHDESERFWDDADGIYYITKMDWFIKKGATIKEEAPVSFDYRQVYLTSEGASDEIEMTVYVFDDPYSESAPTYVKDAGVTECVKVTADLSRIPESKFKKRKGMDGEMYFDIAFKIRITHYSAYTTYELVYKNVNYGLVKAEYV